MLYVARNNQLLSGDNGCIRVWNLVNGDCERKIFAHNWIVLNLVALNGVYKDINHFTFVSNDFNTIKVWHLDTEQCLYSIKDEIEKSFFNCLIALPEISLNRNAKRTNNDNDVIQIYSSKQIYVATGSDDGLIRVWDMSQRKCLRRLKMGFDRTPISSLVYLTNTNELISATCLHMGGSVHVWNVMRGECIKSLVAGACESLHILPNTGHLVTGGMDGSIKVWLLMSNCSKQRNKFNFMLPHHQHYILKEHDATVNGLEFYSKEMLTVGQDGEDFFIVIE